MITLPTMFTTCCIHYGFSSTTDIIPAGRGLRVKCWRSSGTNLSVVETGRLLRCWWVSSLNVRFSPQLRYMKSSGLTVIDLVGMLLWLTQFLLSSPNLSGVLTSWEFSNCRDTKIMLMQNVNSSVHKVTPHVQANGRHMKTAKRLPVPPVYYFWRLIVDHLFMMTATANSPKTLHKADVTALTEVLLDSKFLIAVLPFWASLVRVVSSTLLSGHVSIRCWIRFYLSFSIL